jgi:ABC-2 type transport system permease protein
VTYVSLAIGGLNFVQFIVPVPAMLLITSEYATRSITSSLQAVPARTRLLLGKAGIVAAFGFGLGTLLGVVGVAVGVPALGDTATSRPVTPYAPSWRSACIAE